MGLDSRHHFGSVLLLGFFCENRFPGRLQKEACRDLEHMPFSEDSGSKEFTGLDGRHSVLLLAFSAGTAFAKPAKESASQDENLTYAQNAE